MINTPDDFSSHIKRAIGAIILRISHRYEVRDDVDKDPFITIADKILDYFSHSVTPGLYLVDVPPILRHLPSWFPGAGFKRAAKLWREDIERMVEAAGVDHSSFTATHLKEQPEEEHLIKWATTSMYMAGSDTTAAVFEACLYFMTTHLDIRLKVQAEIDRVIGNDRLPDFSDRDNLPYINAFCKELFRWRSVTSINLPHRVEKDDMYNGYLIPRGAIVLVNQWQMTHDERNYRKPMAFYPERFIANDGKGPERDPFDTMCFGFGRRICPGILLSDATVFLMSAMMAATFDITKLVENAVIVEPVYEETTSAGLSYLSQFRCSIKPRSRLFGSFEANERAPRPL